jgi:endonuclease-3
MAQKIRTILRLIEKAYGKPRPFRRSDPVDELVRTILSQNTSDTNSLAAFAVLKKSFRDWESLLRADTRKISGLIRHAGLANIKAHRIKDALEEIKRREDSLSLDALSKMDDDDALAYLRTLKGVGPKTAACVLLFSFGKPVMPVDTHIFRVAKRLGLIGGGVDIKDAHRVLTAICLKSNRGYLSMDLIYAFHLGIIEHGRRTCKSQNPKCGFCVLYSMCRFNIERRGAN